MRIDIVSIFPQMFAAITDYGVVGRAVQDGLLTLKVWNPREYSTDKHRNIDDRPYGGGPGMVMQAPPLAAALNAARNENAQAKAIYLSPQGRRLEHATVRAWAQTPGLILLAGRYEGVDERLLAHAVDEEWSIGDYVLSGGELPAMVVVDAVTRQLPGVLGHADSAQEDSFVNGLLDCPHYTRPEIYQSETVPAVLLSGDHAQIRRWRLKQSLARTWLRRPDLLAALKLDDEQRDLLEEFQREHAAGVKR